MNIEKILCETHSVQPIDLEKAKSYQSKYGGRLEKLLVNMGSLSEDALPVLYSELLSLELHDSLPDVITVGENYYEQFDAPNIFDIEFCISNLWIPYYNEGHLVFITNDPLHWEVNQSLLDSGLEFTLYLVNKALVEEAFSYTTQSPIENERFNSVEEEKLRELASEAPTVNLLNSLFTRGVEKKASDLHIEPIAGLYRVRYRIDGVLRDFGTLPASLSLPVISRVKILSNMDIAEKRRPQDGKIETRIANVELDIRVSILPLNKGESVVLRFLRKDSISYSMRKLGISADLLSKINNDLRKTSGVILLTGPTGSGKTTSLYTFLNELNTEDVKIITLEDPVEYQLEGVNQVQVNSDIGFDFSSGLRSIVRQDPDIIMLGEIRDRETARIAMQSALTGHLVFSTVHTNDAPGAYTRLVDLGVEEFLLNAAIVSVMAQRLVRKVCLDCCTPIPFSDLDAKHRLSTSDLLKGFEFTEENFVQANGCDECNNTGYKGRMSIMEYLPCDDTIKSLSKNSNFTPHARSHNQALGNRTLFQDGILKAADGLTTVDEVLRVCA